MDFAVGLGDLVAAIFAEGFAMCFAAGFAVGFGSFAVGLAVDTAAESFDVGNLTENFETSVDVLDPGVRQLL